MEARCSQFTHLRALGRGWTEPRAGGLGPARHPAQVQALLLTWAGPWNYSGVWGGRTQTQESGI